MHNSKIDINAYRNVPKYNYYIYHINFWCKKIDSYSDNSSNKVLTAYNQLLNHERQMNRVTFKILKIFAYLSNDGKNIDANAMKKFFEILHGYSRCLLFRDLYYFNKQFEWLLLKLNNITIQEYDIDLFDIYNVYLYAPLEENYYHDPPKKKNKKEEEPEPLNVLLDAK